MDFLRETSWVEFLFTKVSLCLILLEWDIRMIILSMINYHGYCGLYQVCVIFVSIITQVASAEFFML